MNKIKQLAKKLQKTGGVGIVAAILALVGGARAYALTDGFCSAVPLVTHVTQTEFVPSNTSSIKTSTLDADKESVSVPAVQGKNLVTYAVKKHCGKMKSRSVERTQVLTLPIKGVKLVGTRHDIREKTDIPYDTIHVNDPDSYVNTSSVTTKGVFGSQELTYTVAQDEGQPETKTFKNKEVFLQPVSEVISDGTKQHEYVKVVTYPVAYPGQYASFTAETLPNSTCNITVRYSSGYSSAEGLYTKTASNDGSISWSWKVGTRTYSGSWPINVVCTLDGDKASASSQIIVN